VLTPIIGRDGERSDTPIMAKGTRGSRVGADALFRRLRRDHRHVLEQMDAHEAALRQSKRATAKHERTLRDVLALLGTEFASHMTAEDDVLYPALLAALPAAAGSIEALAAEHRELRQMLQRLRELLEETASPERAEQIRVQIQDLGHLLRLHVEKEETLVFRLAPRLLAPREIAALAARLAPRTTEPLTRSKGVS